MNNSLTALLVLIVTLSIPAQQDSTAIISEESQGAILEIGAENEEVVDLSDTTAAVTEDSLPPIEKMPELISFIKADYPR